MKDLSKVSVGNLKISVASEKTGFLLRVQQKSSKGELIELSSNINIKNLVELLGFCQKSLTHMIGY